MLTTAKLEAHFDKVRALDSASRAVIRADSGKTEIAAMCGAFQVMPKSTEQGPDEQTDAIVRIKVSDFPPTGFPRDRIEVRLPGETEWRVCRITRLGRIGGGIMPIMVGGLYG